MIADIRHTEPVRMRVLTAIPVYNEERHLERVLEEVRRHAGDILVVNDGSSDRTGELLARVEGIRVITHAQNRGYGAALASAFDFALSHDYARRTASASTRSSPASSTAAMVSI
jgi:glycosyltransferase involved in cell wall biosynthesis